MSDRCTGDWKRLRDHLATSAAWLWGVLLAASILVAWLKLYPDLVGRVILGLIAGGFLLFGIARRSVAPLHKGPASCASLLSRRMRALYWAGYALMASGVVLTALVSLGGSV